jgi:hypothetical protein
MARRADPEPLHATRQVIDELDTIIERQITGDPLWAVLRMEFWLVVARDPEIRRRLVGKSEPYRELAGELIDDTLAREGRTAPFTGRDLGSLLNALATGLAIQIQHEPDAVDWKLLARAARRLAGLDESAAMAGASDADAPTSPTHRSPRRS